MTSWRTEHLLTPHFVCVYRKPLRKHHRHGYSAILEHEHENGSAPSSPTANGNGNGTGNGHRKGQPDGGYRSLARGWPGHASTEHLDMLVHHDEELVGVGVGVG